MNPPDPMADAINIIRAEFGGPDPVVISGPSVAEIPVTGRRPTGVIVDRQMRPIAEGTAEERITAPQIEMPRRTAQSVAREISQGAEVRLKQKHGRYFVLCCWPWRSTEWLQFSGTSWFEALQGLADEMKARPR